MSTRPDGRDLTEFSTRAPLESHQWSSQSSNVHSALYDFGTNDLYVRYKRDGVDAIYVYSFVPASTWNDLVEASSKGGYINSSIAYAFRYEKISLSDWPQKGRGVQDAQARSFLTAPMSNTTTASHPYIES